MIVESHAGDSTSIKAKAVMTHARLNERHQLRFVAGKTARHERRAQGERQQTPGRWAVRN